LEPKTEEKKMKLISNLELQRKSDSELAALFHHVSQVLTRTKRQSQERRNALATLENICRERARRHRCPSP
jgi:uncharacterized protein YciW